MNILCVYISKRIMNYNILFMANYTRGISEATSIHRRWCTRTATWVGPKWCSWRRWIVRRCGLRRNGWLHKSFLWYSHQRTLNTTRNSLKLLVNIIKMFAWVKNDKNWILSSNYRMRRGRRRAQVLSTRRTTTHWTGRTKSISNRSCNRSGCRWRS